MISPGPVWILTGVGVAVGGSCVAVGSGVYVAVAVGMGVAVGGRFVGVGVATNKAITLFCPALHPISNSIPSTNNKFRNLLIIGSL